MTSQAIEKTGRNEVKAFRPDDVNKAWKQANEGMKSVVCFGAMMEVLNRSLTRQTTADEEGKFTGREGGLKGWLEANCPDVNYKTAMGYKRLASIAAAGFKVDVAEMFHLLRIPSVHQTPSEQAKTEIIDKYLSGASHRSLLNDWATNGSKPGAVAGSARRKPEKPTPEEADAKLAELANHGITSARNSLVEIAGNPELLSRLDRSTSRTCIKDIKTALQKIAEAIA